jgi:hypothetical protein
VTPLKEEEGRKEVKSFSRFSTSSLKEKIITCGKGK